MHELKHVLKCFSDNKLSINFKKQITANYLTKEKCDITIKTCDIERKKKIKYLGVFIYEHLQWDDQLQHITKQNSQEHWSYK
jgi:hypothetical protein